MTERFSVHERFLPHTGKVITLLGLVASIGFFITDVAGLDYPALTDGKSPAILSEAVVETLKSAVIALLIAFGSDRAGSIIDALISERRVDSRMDQLASAIFNITSVQLVGPSDGPMHELEASLRRSTRVKNTFLNVGGAHGADNSIEKAILGVYKDFLGRDDSVLWQDVVSVNELHTFRHTKLNQGEVKGTHQIAVLRSSMPIINFVIVADPSRDSKQVYFGWIYDKSRSVTKIYKSDAPDIVNMFETYFDILWSEKSAEIWSVNYDSPPSDRGPKRNFIVDKSGLWVTAAIDRKTGEPINFAALSIDFDAKYPIIQGGIIKDQANGNRRFRHTDVTEAPNKLYFEYEDSLKAGAQRGFCVYGFERRGDQDVIVGYILEGVHRARTPIIGVKVRARPGEGSHPADVDSVESIEILVGAYEEAVLQTWENERSWVTPDKPGAPDASDEPATPAKQSKKARRKARTSVDGTPSNSGA